MNQPDNKIDHMLRAHLARELDPHLGRFEKAFMAQSQKDQQIRQRFNIRYWSAAAVILLSLSIAATLFIHTLLKSHNASNPRQGNTVAEAEPQPLMPITQSVDWHIVDDGTVALNGDIPIRQYRQQVVERTRWYDPKRKTTYELSIPREEVMLISN